MSKDVSFGTFSYDSFFYRNVYLFDNKCKVTRDVTPTGCGRGIPLYDVAIVNRPMTVQDIAEIYKCKVCTTCPVIETNIKTKRYLSIMSRINFCKIPDKNIS